MTEGTLSLSPTISRKSGRPRPRPPGDKQPVWTSSPDRVGLGADGVGGGEVDLEALLGLPVEQRPDIKYSGTRHPDTIHLTSRAAWRGLEALDVRRRDFICLRKDLHVGRAAVPLKRNPKASRGVGPAWTESAPAQVVGDLADPVDRVVGHRRISEDKAHTEEADLLDVASSSCWKPRALYERESSSKGTTDASFLLFSRGNHCYEKPTSRELDPLASLFGQDLDLDLAAEGDLDARGSCDREARRADGAGVLVAGDGDLGESSFRCSGRLVKRRGDLSFVFTFFPLGPGKLKRASSAAEPRGGLWFSTTLEAVC